MVTTIVTIAGRNRAIISSMLLLYKECTLYYHYSITSQSCVTFALLQPHQPPPNKPEGMNKTK